MPFWEVPLAAVSAPPWATSLAVVTAPVSAVHSVAPPELPLPYRANVTTGRLRIITTMKSRTTNAITGIVVTMTGTTDPLPGVTSATAVSTGYQPAMHQGHRCTQLHAEPGLATGALCALPFRAVKTESPLRHERSRLLRPKRHVVQSRTQTRPGPLPAGMPSACPGTMMVHINAFLRL